MNTEASTRLRLVKECDNADVGDDDEQLVDQIRATRRSAARFLRALHVSGHHVASWPDPLVSRLAHADAVTARFLGEPDRVARAEVCLASAALHGVLRTMIARLSPGERARVRSYELAIRIEADTLSAPLLQPARAPEDDAPLACGDSDLRPCSLRAGLGALDDASLMNVARRLGIGRRLERLDLHVTPGRAELEERVEQLLRDDHLLGILVATLPQEALVLLSGLVRNTIEDQALESALGECAVAAAVGDAVRSVPPSELLEQCGLAFRGGTPGRSMWVPIELCHRLDGVLRALGI